MSNQRRILNDIVELGLDPNCVYSAEELARHRRERDLAERLKIADQLLALGEKDCEPTPHGVDDGECSTGDPAIAFTLDDLADVLEVDASAALSSSLNVELEITESLSLQIVDAANSFDNTVVAPLTVADEAVVVDEHVDHPLVDQDVLDGGTLELEVLDGSTDQKSVEADAVEPVQPKKKPKNALIEKPSAKNEKTPRSGGKFTKKVKPGTFDE